MMSGSDLAKLIAIALAGVLIAVNALEAVGQERLSTRPDRDSRPSESEPDDSADAPVRQGPAPVKPGDVGVGRLISDLAFTDLNGNDRRLSEFEDASAVVLALTGTGCPLCLKYAPSLARIEQDYRQRGARFVFINPNESEGVDRLRDAISSHGFQGPYVKDGNKELLRELEAETTTEVFVLDRARTLVYRGAVDDQYGFGYALDAPRHEYLIDALEAVFADRPPAVAATSSPGCEIYYGNDDNLKKPVTVTYHNRISRIIQANCIECHRDTGIAPIALETYEEVKDYAGMIRRVVERGIMPPWYAAPDQHGDAEPHSHPIWANDRSLSEAETADLVSWIESGAPQGDPSDAPLPRKFPDGWLIGEPDAVFEFPEPVKIKATGILPYKNIVIDTNLAEDKWVSAIEVVPGDRRVVHHVLVFALAPEGTAKRGRGGVDYWGIYVPGNSTQIYPEGYARKLPAGSRLKFQMHYTTNGVATEDRTKIGLVFAKAPPRHEVRTASILNSDFRIPPGAANHRVEASIELPADIQVLGYLPHHHLRGKACRYELTTPTGEREVLLDVPRYDFNWQLFYQYAEPRLMRRGSRIDFTAWYDNSDRNPANPDPTVTVRWGEQTYDEMHLGYIEYVIPGESRGNDGTDLQQRRASDSQDESRTAKLLRRIDVNGDGWITRDEVRQRLPGDASASGQIFDQLDRNGDDKLDREELSRLGNRRP